MHYSETGYHMCPASASGRGTPPSAEPPTTSNLVPHTYNTHTHTNTSPIGSDPSQSVSFTLPRPCSVGLTTSRTHPAGALPPQRRRCRPRRQLVEMIRSPCMPFAPAAAAAPATAAAAAAADPIYISECKYHNTVDTHTTGEKQSPPVHRTSAVVHRLACRITITV